MFLLLLVALTLLVVLTARHEASRVQEQVDALATDAAAKVRSELLRSAADAAGAGGACAVAGALACRRQPNCCARTASCCASNAAAPDWQIGAAVDSPFGSRPCSR